jgi:ABC-type uncharacterized transport system substrate-binding protein
LRALLALLPLLLLPLPAAAHPHVWIDASLGYVVEDASVTALQVTWVFDDLYSALVLEDFDGDGDGTLSQQELDALVGISAVNLMAYSFFTHVKIDGEKHYVALVKEFYAEVTEEDLILYRFRVPLPAPTAPQQLAVGLFDDSYYVDIALAEGDVRVPDGCRAALQQDRNEPLYYGSYFPTYVHLDCSQS